MKNSLRVCAVPFPLAVLAALIVPLVFCQLIFSGSAPVQKAQNTSRNIPITATRWVVDPNSYGYQTDQGDFQKPRLLRFHSSVRFLGENEIVQTLLNYEHVEDLQRRDDPNRRYPYTLRAIFIDTRSGKAVRGVSWGSDYSIVGLVPRDGGAFAVFLGDRIEFYGPNFEPKSELRLPAKIVEGHSIWFSNSPSGETMLVVYPGGARSQCIWVVGESIAARDVDCEVLDGASVTDDEIVAATRRDDEWNDVTLSLLRSGGSWQKLCHSFQKNGCNIPQFLSDSVISTRGEWRIQIIGEDRKASFQLPSSDASGFSYVNSYADGPKLLAVPSFEPNFGVSAIHVYSLTTKRRVFAINKEGKVWFPMLEGLAVSPDGDTLAVEARGILRFYDLARN